MKTVRGCLWLLIWPISVPVWLWRRGKVGKILAVVFGLAFIGFAAIPTPPPITTVIPTNSETPAPTATTTLTSTPIPAPTATTIPTDTPIPAPTATPIPTETPTDTPSPTPPPTEPSIVAPLAPTATFTPEAAKPGANSVANLRAGPGTEYAVVGQAQAGQTLEIVARNGAGDWYQLVDGTWIVGFLVDNAPDVGVAANIPAPPVVAAPSPIAAPPPAAVAPTSPPAFIQPTAAPPATACSCNGDTYNCPAFGSHAAAQACFDYCVSVGVGDIHRLDQDNDGNACESLP